MTRVTRRPPPSPLLLVPDWARCKAKYTLPSIPAPTLQPLSESTAITTLSMVHHQLPNSQSVMPAVEWSSGRTSAKGERSQRRHASVSSLESISMSRSSLLSSMSSLPSTSSFLLSFPGDTLKGPSDQTSPICVDLTSVLTPPKPVAFSL